MGRSGYVDDCENNVDYINWRGMVASAIRGKRGQRLRGKEMKRIEYRTADKSTWGDGPWQNEPDKVQWLDEATGLPCMIRRNNSLGFWCGYVGVPSTNRLYRMDYDKADGEFNLEVHGGLTFGNTCGHGDEATDICHIVEPGEDDNVWWLGFDCGHGWDSKPGMFARELAKYGWTPDPSEVYRDQAYVTREVLNLAKQIAVIPPQTQEGGGT